MKEYQRIAIDFKKMKSDHHYDWENIEQGMKQYDEPFVNGLMLLHDHLNEGETLHFVADESLICFPPISLFHSISEHTIKALLQCGFTYDPKKKRIIYNTK